MHPRGGFGIVFNFGDSLYLDAQAITAPIFLDGTNTFSRKMGFLGHIDLIGISFWEGGAYPFVMVPLAELRNEIALLDVLNSPSLIRLHERLYEAESLPTHISLIEQWLLSRLSLGMERNPLIPASLAALREGNLSILTLAQKFSISQRQMERLYQMQVGMTPKHYSQLVRVETARLALREMNGQSTTSLAADLGFYDQSHFIREFSAVIGMTPYAYMQRSQKRTRRKRVSPF